jgi:plastocyanin
MYRARRHDTAGPGVHESRIEAVRIMRMTQSNAEAIMTHGEQMRICTLAIALAALAACGGEKSATDSTAMRADSAGNAPGMSPAPGAGGSAAATTTPSAAPGAAPAAAPAAATGATHDVQMLGDATGYKFNPASITIKRGDAVRWTMVSGGPHNTTFWADSIPSGAQATLAANMPTPMAPLTGPLLMNPNQTYTVSFANVPAGTYKYYCTPHLALGMKGVIQVQ